MKFVLLLEFSFIFFSVTFTNGLIFDTDQRGKYNEDNGLTVEYPIAARIHNKKYKGSDGNKLLESGNAVAQISGNAIPRASAKPKRIPAPSKDLMRLHKFSRDLNLSHNMPVSQKHATLDILESNAIKTIQHLKNCTTAFNESEKFKEYSKDITIPNPQRLLKGIVFRSSGNYIPKTEKYLDNMTEIADLSPNITSLLKVVTNDVEKKTRVSKDGNEAIENETNIKEFSYQLQKPNFSIEEIMRIIKREHNIQIKILNELVLYFPVLFCDILLLVACWKLLYYIFQQISERDQTNSPNEVSQVDLEPWSKFKKRTLSSWNPKNSDHHNYTESFPNSCKGKAWFPPK